ncbi:LysR family transcriptional regulator [Hypericibacter sp.]|uniref:LysR family transcriptional regulator n=1 Tax=Hypericibacter sp. TaxID=2705401 RepID=UPI003D6D8E71
MDKFDLNLLRVFDAVWRHGHLGLASKELELSQPALSHALKRLRKSIGDPLFVKVPTGMQPTARAVQLAPVVQSMLASVRERVLAAPVFDPKTARRSFTIAMTDVGELAMLPKLVGRLMSEAPAVDVRSVSMPPRDLTAALQNGQVDLAIGHFPDIGGTDLLQQRLFRDRFVCVVRAGHPAAHGGLTPKRFRDLPHAVVQTEGRSQEIVEQYLRRHGVRRRELLRSPHFLSIPMVIASTDLVVTVPVPIGELFGRIADLQILQPPFPIPSIDIMQYWHRQQHSDPGNRWLRSIVLDLFGE